MTTPLFIIGLALSVSGILVSVLSSSIIEIVPVEGKIMTSLTTNVFDVMISDREKSETTRVTETKSIRFDYRQTTYECQFFSRLASESQTNLTLIVNSSWIPSEKLPPLPTVPKRPPTSTVAPP